MLEKLKALNQNSLERILDNDEAVALSAFVRSMENEYGHLDMPMPDYLEKAGELLRNEIARRTHAADMAELRRVEAELDSLKTTNERKNDAQNRLAALQNKLGLTTKKAR